MFGHLVTEAIKPIIVENLSEFQIGAIPGHRSDEHIFTLKSVLALKEKNNESIVAELLDLSKYFDKESLIDVLGELYKSNDTRKLYKLVHELNNNTRVIVKTAVGETEKKKCQ